MKRLFARLSSGQGSSTLAYCLLVGLIGLITFGATAGPHGISFSLSESYSNMSRMLAGTFGGETTGTTDPAPCSDHRPPPCGVDDSNNPTQSEDFGEPPDGGSIPPH